MYHDLKAFRLSKAYAKDLEYLITSTQEQINKLSMYSKYSSVKRILACLNEELGYMKAHRDKCQRLINTKGQIDELK